MKSISSRWPNNALKLSRICVAFFRQCGCAAFLANNPECGDVVPSSGGCRKIRWTRAGSGKRGGVRVIYTVRLARGALVLLTIYSKSTRESIPPHVLRKIAEEMGDAT